MRTILVTGSEGYLMKALIARLVEETEVAAVIGVDIVPGTGADHGPKYSYHQFSVTDGEALLALLKEAKADTVVHGAWIFNPVHDLKRHADVDIGGSETVFSAAAKSGTVTQIVYPGSTTAYAALPENNHPDGPDKLRLLKEEEWNEHKEKRKAIGYPYAKDKAIVDDYCQEFAATHPAVNLFWLRGCIVIGQKTDNLMAYIARSPFTLGLFMFQVKGYDPYFQFCGEEDMVEVLRRSTLERWSGVANVAGDGAIRFSEVIKAMGKRAIVLPEGILKGLVGLLWRLRILRFPPTLIDFTMHPWVGDITRLKEVYGYTPKLSTRQAIAQFTGEKV